MEELILLVLVFLPLTQEQVILDFITPSGPLYIPINTKTSIYCLPAGRRSVGWEVTVRNCTLSDSFPGPLCPGIVIDHANRTFSSIIVNISEASLIYLNCKATFQGKSPDYSSINITVYGVPTSVENPSISVNGSNITASWMYETMPYINVTFNLSLTFSEPNKFPDIATDVVKQSHTFIIANMNNMSPCGSFTFCITASNLAGTGNKSCVINNLPYLPTMDRINVYSISGTDQMFSIIVEVMVPRMCYDSTEGSYLVLEVTSNQTENQYSDSTKLMCLSYLKVNNLSKNASYLVVVISNNNIGEVQSMPRSFSSGDNITQTMNVRECASTTTTELVSTSGSSSTATTITTKKATSSTTAIVTIVMVILAVLAIFIISVFVVICLCRHGYCGKTVYTKHNLKAPDQGQATTEFNSKSAPDNILYSEVQQDEDPGAQYSTLNRLGTSQEVTSSETANEENYSQLQKEPVYFILEKEPTNEDISKDPDAPALPPPFCPSGGDSPPHSGLTETKSSMDTMYAEVSNIRAKK